MRVDMGAPCRAGILRWPSNFCWRAGAPLLAPCSPPSSRSRRGRAPRLADSCERSVSPTLFAAKSKLITRAFTSWPTCTTSAVFSTKPSWQAHSESCQACQVPHSVCRMRHVSDTESIATACRVAHHQLRDMDQCILPGTIIHECTICCHSHLPERKNF